MQSLRSTFYFLNVCFIFLFSPFVYAQENEVVIPVIIDNRVRENITAYLSDDGEFLSIHADEFLALLGKNVSASTLKILQQKIETKNQKKIIQYESLKEAGLQTKFNLNTLSLDVVVNPIIRKEQEINLGRRIPTVAEAEIWPQSDFSAYINARIDQDFNYFESGSFAKRTPLAASFEPNINIASFVIEGLYTYQEEEESPWLRRDFLLVKDFEKHFVRASLGDIIFPVDNFQSFRSTGGISVTRDFSLDPYKVTYPSESQSIFLRQDSEVDVYVNNNRARNLQLRAGKYNLQDLPLNVGVNDVRLEVKDRFGKRETIFVQLVQEPNLLKKGLHEYTYNVGFPASRRGAGIFYDSSNTTYSMFHRYGFYQHFTAGGFFQGDSFQKLYGLETSWSTLWGSFELENALSTIDDIGTAYAARLSYSYRAYKGLSNSQRGIRVSVLHQGRRFGALGNLVPNNSVKIGLSSSFSQLLTESMSLGLGLNYDFNRNTTRENVDSYRINLTVNRRWMRSLNSSVTLNYARNRLDDKELTAFFFLSYSRPQKNQFVTVTADTATDNRRVSWDYNSPRRTDTFRTRMSVEQSEDSKGAEMEVSYDGNRMDVDFAHELRKDDFQPQQQISKLNLSTAIAFSGKSFAWSQPISDGFVLFRRHSDWSGQTLNINPDSAGNYDAQINNWGSAVVPDLQPYRYHQMHVDGSTLELGRQLGKENYILRPTYKSAAHIDVGTDATAYASGVLMVAKKEIPYSLKAGEIIPKDGSVALEFFTDRDGNFWVEGLKAGKYKIKSFDGFHAEFEIPEGTVGFFELGILYLK